MRKISDTISRIAALQARRGANMDHAGAAVHLQQLPHFGSNPGSLRAKYYLPEPLPRGAPLVVVLHGCTQSASGYDHHSGWSKLAAEAGFGLLYPEQQRSNNPSLCFNWFQPADYRRGAGEALSIRQMVEAMALTYGFDPDRVFVTGLSAGGAMAAVMLAAYPGVFSGGAIIAGLPYGSAVTASEAFDRMRGHGGPLEQDLHQAILRASDHGGPWPRVSLWQGTADQIVAPSNADAIAAQWRGVHGLEKTPTRSDSDGKRTKNVWCDKAGDAIIEVNLIEGMGHGTPIGDGLGRPGPYMLDVGISSTTEIARFWGILDRKDSVTPISRQEGRDRERPPFRAQEKGGDRPNTEHLEATISHQFASTVPVDGTGVKKIIEDALRAAGLMT